MTNAAETLDDNAQDLWVFGYGSLLWSPCFEVAETSIATLHGYHRSFCMWSIHYRGTPDAPGLVLALDKADGATCQGMAFRVPGSHRAAALSALRERELVSSAYLEAWLSTVLNDGRRIDAVTYVIDPHHDQYAAGLTLEHQAQTIANAHGDRGPNRDYLANTHAHLHDAGIADPDMDWLMAAVFPK
ncbi:MAG: gamma-glutamylcyclotransferase [Pseudomonadota bacterium]